MRYLYSFRKLYVKYTTIQITKVYKVSRLLTMAGSYMLWQLDPEGQSCLAEEKAQGQGCHLYEAVRVRE